MTALIRRLWIEDNGRNLAEYAVMFAVIGDGREYYSTPWFQLAMSSSTAPLFGIGFSRAFTT